MSCFTLEIRIYETPQDVALSQSCCTERVFHKFKYLNFNVVKIPNNSSFTFQNKEGKVIPNQFCKSVGKVDVYCEL